MTKEEREKARLDRAIRKERRESKRAERERRRAIRQERRRLRELSASRPIPRIEGASSIIPWPELRLCTVAVFTPDGIKRLSMEEAEQYAYETRQERAIDAISGELTPGTAEADKGPEGQLILF
jgi:uncharacterized protein YhaN